MIRSQAGGVRAAHPDQPALVPGDGSHERPKVKNGRSLTEAQKMADHADPRTTKLYDRTGDTAKAREIGRLSI